MLRLSVANPPHTHLTRSVTSLSPTHRTQVPQFAPHSPHSLDSPHSPHSLDSPHSPQITLSLKFYFSYSPLSLTRPAHSAKHPQSAHTTSKTQPHLTPLTHTTNIHSPHLTHRTRYPNIHSPHLTHTSADMPPLRSHTSWFPSVRSLKATDSHSPHSVTSGNRSVRSLKATDSNSPHSVTSGNRSLSRNKYQNSLSSHSDSSSANSSDSSESTHPTQSPSNLVRRSTTSARPHTTTSARPQSTPSNASSTRPSSHSHHPPPDKHLTSLTDRGDDERLTSLSFPTSNASTPQSVSDDLQPHSGHLTHPTHLTESPLTHPTHLTESRFTHPTHLTESHLTHQEGERMRRAVEQLGLTTVNLLDGEVLAIGAIDQGTQTTKFSIYDATDLSVIASVSKKHAQIIPQQGWAEHDPLEIMRNVYWCMGHATRIARKKRGSVHIVGIGESDGRGADSSRNDGLMDYMESHWR
eukprot:GHVN01048037.1.p1 GENE.GHVN01048037.1~~GHVN01048037.1.p1  ORF type:complete len:466 (-),score=201.51 GHVN01048037.1:934-2331(-)